MTLLYLGLLCLNERDVQSKIPANAEFFYYLEGEIYDIRKHRAGFTTDQKASAS